MSLQVMNLEGKPIEIETSTLSKFKASLHGPLLREGDPGYEDSRKLWNGMIDRKPALIVRATGTADVVECINFARTNHLLFSVKGGGHNIAGTAVTNGGLTLDMSLLKGVLVDPKEFTVTAQAGCILGDVDRETQLHGLATSLGFVSLTGVAGLTLGGGFGYLTRRFGWTVDNLLEVEVVTSDGRVLQASEKDHEDLFWALRGGGGNFGVVTSFKFRLHPLGPKIVGGIIGWPASRAEEVLKLYRKVTTSAPRELTLVLTIRFAPPAPYVPPEWQGKPIIGIITCYSGSLDGAKSALAPLRELGEPIFDTLVEKTYVQQQSLLDAVQPSGNHYYWKSEYFPTLTDDALGVLVKQGTQETSSLSQLVLFHLEGALAERPVDDGAVGNRNAAYAMVIVGGWRPDDTESKRHIAWVRSAWEDLRRFSTGGHYVNFETSDEGEDRVRATYGQNFTRLAEIKAKYDPDNMFRMNRNISPAA